MKISVSIDAGDLANIKESLDKVRLADFIHCDIMDGHFVPNISFGIDICKAIKKNTVLPLDVHLMVDNPSKHLDKYIEIAEMIAVHFEIQENAEELLKKIRQKGVKAGLAIKPQTTIPEIEHLLDKVDFILVLGVEPGYSGQKFIEDIIPKFKQLREIQEKKQLNFIIGVDGGINMEIAHQIDVDLIVSGSYIFNSDNIPDAISSLRNQESLKNFIEKDAEK